jgi:hypothetical protein
MPSSTRHHRRQQRGRGGQRHLRRFAETPGNPGLVQIANSVIYGAAVNCDGGLFQSLGHNISKGSCASLSAATDQENIAGNLQLGALTYNGGAAAMQTMLPQVNSPLIDAAGDCTGNPQDQRGVPRPYGAACDVGAVESVMAACGETASSSGDEATSTVALPTAVAQAAAAAPAAQAAAHPRLWLTPADVTRLRGWATEANPLYVDGLLPVAARAVEEMDAGRVPGEDCGQRAYSEYPTEAYAQLFAFMSLIDPSPAARDDYAQRARTLLMHVMDAAAQGPATEQNYFCPGDPETAVYPPFRDPIFFTEDSDRLRWHGEAFPLTVDWIYDTLTAQDKATINTVFTRWGDEIIQSGYHRPEPVGVTNDPVLTADRLQVRWAGNNYFAAHMRNLGMMSLALDPADASPALQGYLANATGAWLYLFDAATRGDVRGGLLPEGFEYSPQTASYALQFLLALRTAGRANPADLGPQVVVDDNPFWDDFVASYLHAISPDTVENPDNGLQVFQPAWYGDAQRYLLPDFIDAFGALALHDQQTGNSQRLNAVRWIQLYTTPGGAANLVERVRGADYFRSALLYFMLFDPDAAPPADPRTTMPNDYVAAGMQRLFSRTDWSRDASWLTYALSWNQIDHQHGGRQPLRAVSQRRMAHQGAHRLRQHRRGHRQLRVPQHTRHRQQPPGGSRRRATGASTCGAAARSGTMSPAPTPTCCVSVFIPVSPMWAAMRPISTIRKAKAPPTSPMPAATWSGSSRTGW